MDRCRTTLARACLLLGMCAWVAGSFAMSLHEVLVQHTVCAEHGELVELDSADGATLQAASNDRIGSAVPGPSHDHGCSFDVLCLDGISVPAPAVPAAYLLPWPAPTAIAIAEAPRAPPLAYAPKTSPPSTC